MRTAQAFLAPRFGGISMGENSAADAYLIPAVACAIAIRFWSAGSLRSKSAIGRAKARPILSMPISINQRLKAA
jgi:hypothetical protein